MGSWGALALASQWTPHMLCLLVSFQPAQGSPSPGLYFLPGFPGSWTVPGHCPSVATLGLGYAVTGPEKVEALCLGKLEPAPPLPKAGSSVSAQVGRSPLWDSAE